MPDVTLAERAGLRPIEAPYRSGEVSRERLGALRALYEREQIDLVHGQHVLTCLPSVQAAKRAGMTSRINTMLSIPMLYFMVAKQNLAVG